MAISPNQLKDTFMEEVDYYETKIDAELARLKIGNNLSVSIDTMFGMTGQHFQVLRQRYIDAGWANVTWHSDQRQGDCMVFSTVKFKDSV
jgi:hypothetical protein